MASQHLFESVVYSARSQKTTANPERESMPPEAKEWPAVVIYRATMVGLHWSVSPHSKNSQITADPVAKALQLKRTHEAKLIEATACTYDQLLIKN